MSEPEIKTGVIRPVECLKEGWELIKDQYWILFGVTAVGAMLGGASLYILLGAMMCGIFHCYILKIDGKPMQFNDLFSGFEYISAGLVLGLIIILPTIIMMAVVYIPIIIAMVMGPRLSEDELIGLLVGGFALDFVLMILMTCFHTLLMFAFPLLVDRNLSAMQAVKTSAKAVWRNLSGVAGLFGAGFVLNMLGVLACGIGVYFTIPIIIAGNVVAYRKVFPNAENRFQPPPPDAYHGVGSYT